MLDKLTAADFRTHLDTAFTIRPARHPAFEVTLVDVTEHPHPPSRPEQRRGFSLLFRASDARVLPQGTHHVEHPVMAAMDVFMVPIGPKDGTMRYEVIFN